MKTKYHISIILIPALLLVMAIYSRCKKKELPNDESKTIGYIMDAIKCSGFEYQDDDSAQSIGYIIITENLQDTFKTYTLPNNLNKYPLDFFNNTANYRYSYKIAFEFEDEDMVLACPHGPPDRYPHAKKIKIISANPIN